MSTLKARLVTSHQIKASLEAERHFRATYGGTVPVRVDDGVWIDNENLGTLTGYLVDGEPANIPDGLYRDGEHQAERFRAELDRLIAIHDPDVYAHWELRGDFDERFGLPLVESHHTVNPTPDGAYFAGGNTVTGGLAYGDTQTFRTYHENRAFSVGYWTMETGETFPTYHAITTNEGAINREGFNLFPSATNAQNLDMVHGDGSWNRIQNALAQRALGVPTFYAVTVEGLTVNHFVQGRFRNPINMGGSGPASGPSWGPMRIGRVYEGYIWDAFAIDRVLTPDEMLALHQAGVEDLFTMHAYPDPGYSSVVALAPHQFNQFRFPKWQGQQVLWQDAAGTVPVTRIGDRIGRSDDLSGNERHLTAEGNARPVWVGCHRGVRFDGVAQSHYFDAPNLHGMPAGEVAVSLQLKNQIPTSNNQSGIWAYRSGNNEHYSYQDNNSYIGWGSTGRHTMPSPPVLSQKHVLNIQASDVWEMRINNAIHHAVASNSLHFLSSGSKLGNSIQGGHWLDGSMWEYVIFDRILSEPERAQLHEILT